MSNNFYPCLKCNKNVVNDAIECSLCLAWSHRSCAKLSKKELQLLSFDDNYWYCKDCIAVFPYSSIDEDEFSFIHSQLDYDDDFLYLMNHCKSIEADHNKRCENKSSGFDNKFDPNENFLDAIENTCSYYTQSEFIDKKIGSKNLSIVHFNARSLKNNFESLNTYLRSLDYKFDIIAISESWLCDNDIIDEYEIEDYNMVYMNRKKQTWRWCCSFY